jgi:hypothetical protein
MERATTTPSPSQNCGYSGEEEGAFSAALTICLIKSELHQKHMENYIFIENP